MFSKILLYLLLSFIFPLPLSYAQNSVVKDGYVEAQLISETLSIKPGQAFWVAVRLKMDEDWHTYWKNPGDSGMATHIQWVLPSGFQAGDIQWPYPKRIEQPPLTSYGYDGEVFLLTQINPPKTILDSTITLMAHVNWLMCKIECIPGKAQLTISLPIKNENPLTQAQWEKDFIATRLKLPLHPSPWKISASNQGQHIILKLKTSKEELSPLSEVYFFPDQDNVIAHSNQQVLRPTASGYELILQRSSLASSSLKTLKGVLVTQEGRPISIDIPLNTLPIKTLQPNKQTHLTLFTAIIFAFLGGLLLNLMPCVLPVLSIKILGLIKHSSENKPKMRLHGLIFTFGVLISFWILAGVLILLQSTGQQLGWGFQFQSSLFLIFLSIIFLIFALNLFGVFEFTLPVSISTSPQKSEYLNTFFNGVLATITATPCTAPFMGTALGFALTQPTIIGLTVFTALGIGMSFPYLLLSFFPALLKFLPKPGPWMIHFKRFLGTLLLATVLWLLWLLGTQTNLIKENKPPSSGIHWQNYSPELVDRLRKEYKPIFIDFTARWCLTCQVNEKLVLENSEVVKKFQELNVIAIKADWTLQDDNITQALATFGKNSIPLYVLYGNNPDSDALILPELITPKIVLEALDKIK